MRIAIAGASGLLGSELSTLLTSRGHEVLRLVRRPPRSPDERRWDPRSHHVDAPGLDDVDAAVVLSGASIAGRPWTSARRLMLLTSRLESIRTLARAVSASPRARTLLVASAVGYYGADRGEEVLLEDSAPGEDFLARVCRLDEATARLGVGGADVRVVAVRTGIVLSAAGGYLGPLLPLYRLGLGGPIDDGRQWVPWITRADHVRAMAHLLVSSTLEGPVILAGPQPVRQRDFARALGRSLHRPACLPLPTAVLVPVLGVDMVREVVRAGQRALPSRLLADGFTFTHPTLGAALSWMADGEPRPS